jgi:predicted O-methyltransferase YrrM
MLRAALAEAISLPRFLFEADGQPARRGQATAAKTQYALAELVRLLAPADVLEIGTFFADTANVIAAAIDRVGAGHITTIDPFGGHRVPEIIRAWPESLRKRVTFRPDNSMSFFLYLDEELHARRGRDAPFNIIYVDGHHAFDYAFFDLMRSSLFLRPGGVFVVDNLEQVGPTAAIRLFLERHTHWQLFKAARVPVDDASLAFHPETNSAIILAPDGIEIGALPYRIDLFNLTIFEVAELPIKIQRSALGLLKVVTLFYSRPADFHNTGQDEQIQLGVAEHQVGLNDDDTILIKYDPPLKLTPRHGDRIAAQVELSFTPDGRENLLADASPIVLP